MNKKWNRKMNLPMLFVFAMVLVSLLVSATQAKYVVSVEGTKQHITVSAVSQEPAPSANSPVEPVTPNGDASQGDSNQNPSSAAQNPESNASSAAQPTLYSYKIHYTVDQIGTIKTVEGTAPAGNLQYTAEASVAANGSTYAPVSTEFVFQITEDVNQNAFTVSCIENIQ